MRTTLAVLAGLLALSLALAACDGDNGTEPSLALRSSVSDPAGDEYSSGASEGLVPPDVTRLEAWVEADSLKIEIKFVSRVAPPEPGNPSSVYGYVDLDVDHDPATGMPSIVDAFRPDGGSTGLGVDYFVSMFSSPLVVDRSDGTIMGTVSAEYDENALRLSLPVSAIGSGDGYVKMAIVVGTEVEPTDIAPNNGSLTMVSPTGPPPAVALAETAPSAFPPDAGRAWGR